MPKSTFSFQCSPGFTCLIIRVKLQDFLHTALWVYNLYSQLTKYFSAEQGQVCYEIFELPCSDSRQICTTSADFSMFYTHTHTHSYRYTPWTLRLHTSHLFSMCPLTGQAVLGWIILFDACQKIFMSSFFCHNDATHTGEELWDLGHFCIFSVTHLIFKGVEIGCHPIIYIKHLF